MSGVNKVILLGRLGRDPEISYTNSGMAICKFTLATSKARRDGQEITSWHRCTAFDKRGEAISNHVVKGQQLYIEGELNYGQYEKDGVTRYTTDIIVTQFAFVGDRPKRSDQGHQNSGEVGDGSQKGDDDIPF